MKKRIFVHPNEPKKEVVSVLFGWDLLGNPVDKNEPAADAQFFLSS